MKKLIKREKKENLILSVYDLLGVKLPACLRLHGFADTINAMCTCGSEVETTEHLLLRCHLYSPQRLELFESLEKVDSSFLNLNVKDKVSFLLYGSHSATSKRSNDEIVNFVINYIKGTGRFLIDLFFVQTNNFLMFFLDMYL